MFTGNHTFLCRLNTLSVTKHIRCSLCNAWHHTISLVTSSTQQVKDVIREHAQICKHRRTGNQGRGTQTTSDAQTIEHYKSYMKKTLPVVLYRFVSKKVTLPLWDPNPTESRIIKLTSTNHTFENELLTIKFTKNAKPTRL